MSEETDEYTQGVTCLECWSVLFEVSDLLEHAHKRNHRWYRAGDDRVVRLDTFTRDSDTCTCHCGDGGASDE